MDSAPSDHIFNSFSPATKVEWQKAAKLELNGADPFEKLVFKKGNLMILPYYDQQDVVEKKHFQLKASAKEFLGPRAWYNMPAIDVKNEFDSNQSAISDLNFGADGIFFNIKNTNSDVPAILKKIEWPHCAISFTGDIPESFLSGIKAYATKKNYNVATLTGCVFRKKIFEIEMGSVSQFKNWDNFHPLGIEVEQNAVPAEEIAAALTQAVKQIDFLIDRGLSLKLALQAHAFQIKVETDFFLNIAKLKVLRILWHNVARSFDAKSDVPIFIHACSRVWVKKEYQPNGNMLMSTTAALSAILGGCDALTILPEDGDNSMMTRVAGNVSSILREEAQLSRVADPTAGSYYLESLIDQLSNKAWKIFQKQVSS